MEISNGNPIKILYADDDAEDREFFQDALKEVLTNARVTTVNDGDKLM
jgi:CheY-like chemotaxis protein